MIRVRERDDVYAVEGGTVLLALPEYSKSGKWSAYGNRVYIRHSDGSTAMYGHLDSYSVEVGQVLEEGEYFAVIGDTGNSPSGKHLHINLFTKNAPALTGAHTVDPTFWIQLHTYPTNTIVTGGYKAVYTDRNGNKYEHEGLDTGYTTLIPGYEDGVDALMQDYRTIEDHPEDFV